MVSIAADGNTTLHSGGLTVTSGGVRVTSGGLAVGSGGVDINGGIRLHSGRLEMKSDFGVILEGNGTG
eukprot:CAMPEP_0172490718 /NCGR_PEP_ID=MMETSP1066-20121228/21251_1 /TAXON_ID=671091 /ORGANISM="Coscinodiscus wailesii, Strain CCMP2513" /LENGTH=67 /DNA_ID=CAMNT_0013259331 /DNA_START=105 /DNA_END=304 /DNA_ORIENTATION=-